MHARNVEKGDVDIDPFLGVDVPAFAHFFAAVGRLTERVLIARKLLTEIGVYEFILGIPVLPEDNELTVLVRRVIRRQTRQLSKHKTGLPVRMEVVEHLLGCDNVVITVLRHLFPALLGDILVPRKPELLVMQPKLDLPLLEGHLGSCEVVHIGVGQVVRLDKAGSYAVLDDSLAQVIQLGVVEAQRTSIENMIVVLPAVEADETHLAEGLNLLGGGVDHPMDHRITLNLPVHEEQVREDLDVEEYQLIRREPDGVYLGILVRERHLHHSLDSCVCLMRRIHGECENPRLQILDVVDHVLILGVSENLGNEIDRGFRRRMDLLAQIPLDQVSQLLLVRHCGFVYHLALLKW